MISFVLLSIDEFIDLLPEDVEHYESHSTSCTEAEHDIGRRVERIGIVLFQRIGVRRL